MTWNGVETDPGLRNLFARYRQVDAAAVEADRLDRGGTVWTERCEELLESRFGSLSTDPDDVAGVVVGDDGQELTAAFVGDFVDADAVELVEAGVFDVVGHDSGDDRVDRFP